MSTCICYIGTWKYIILLDTNACLDLDVCTDCQFLFFFDFNHNIWRNKSKLVKLFIWIWSQIPQKAVQLSVFFKLGNMDFLVPASSAISAAASKSASNISTNLVLPTWFMYCGGKIWYSLNWNPIFLFPKTRETVDALDPWVLITGDGPTDFQCPTGPAVAWLRGQGHPNSCIWFYQCRKQSTLIQ